jgi:GAF domain-containing protein
MDDRTTPGSGEASEDASSVPTERAERLLEINTRLNTMRDPDALLDFIIETAADVLDCEAASVLLFDEEAETLRFAASTGSAPCDLAEVSVPLGGSLAGTVFIENRPLVVGDVTKDARHFAPAADEAAFETRSLVGVPMRLDDEPIGVLEGLNKTDGPFTREDVQVLLMLAAQAAGAIRNARWMRALKEDNAHLKSTQPFEPDDLRAPLDAISHCAEKLREEAPTSLQVSIQRLLDAAEQMHEVLDDRRDDG